MNNGALHRSVLAVALLFVAPAANAVTSGHALPSDTDLTSLALSGDAKADPDSKVKKDKDTEATDKAGMGERETLVSTQFKGDGHDKAIDRWAQWMDERAKLKEEAEKAVSKVGKEKAKEKLTAGILALGTTDLNEEGLKAFSEKIHQAVEKELGKKSGSTAGLTNLEDFSLEELERLKSAKLKEGESPEDLKLVDLMILKKEITDLMWAYAESDIKTVEKAVEKPKETPSAENKFMSLWDNIKWEQNSAGNLRAPIKPMQLIEGQVEGESHPGPPAERFADTRPEKGDSALSNLREPIKSMQLKEGQVEGESHPGPPAERFAGAITSEPKPPSRSTQPDTIRSTPPAQDVAEEAATPATQAHVPTPTPETKSQATPSDSGFTQVTLSPKSVSQIPAQPGQEEVLAPTKATEPPTPLVSEKEAQPPGGTSSPQIMHAGGPDGGGGLASASSSGPSTSTTSTSIPSLVPDSKGGNASQIPRTGGNSNSFGGFFYGATNTTTALAAEGTDSLGNRPQNITAPPMPYSTSLAALPSSPINSNFAGGQGAGTNTTNGPPQGFIPPRPVVGGGIVTSGENSMQVADTSFSGSGSAVGTPPSTTFSSKLRYSSNDPTAPPQREKGDRSVTSTNAGAGVQATNSTAPQFSPEPTVTAEPAKARPLEVPVGNGVALFEAESPRTPVREPLTPDFVPEPMVAEENAEPASTSLRPNAEPERQIASIPVTEVPQNTVKNVYSPPSLKAVPAFDPAALLLLSRGIGSKPGSATGKPTINRPTKKSSDLLRALLSSR